MASKIVPLIPPHTVYCEPFAGGAAVFYAKPKPVDHANVYQEVLNDRNADLITMYWKAATSDNFIATIKACPFSDYWHNWANMVLLSPKKDPLSRAVAKYVSHRQGFNNEALSGWARGTFGQDRAKTWEARQNDIGDRCKRLKKCSFDCSDAIDCIKKWDSPHTFFYIDPPYVGTSLGGMGQWSPDDLKKLTDCLNMTRGSFIVSGYNDYTYHLRNATGREFLADCSVASAHKKSTRTRTELIWMRGPAAPVRKSLIPILQKQTCFTGPLLGPCPLPLQRQAG